MQITVDQYSRPLVESVTMKEALGAIQHALKGKHGGERTATAQELVASARAKRTGGRLHGVIANAARALDEIDALRQAPEYRRNVAVGAGQCYDNGCSPGPNSSPLCTRDGRRICDYDRVGVRQAVVAGTTIFSLSPQPGSGFPFWRPKMARANAIDSANPSIPRWEGLFVTQLTVGGHPVEGFNAAPAAGVTQGVSLGDYVVPDPSGIPVGWPEFSITGQARELVFAGISLWNAAIGFNVMLTVLGNPLETMNGRDCRCHQGSSAVPPAGNGRPV